jgi:hypothetical protein
MCRHRAHGACVPEMGHTTWHMGRHWTYGSALRGKVLDICTGQCADICMSVWAWDGAHNMAYGSVVDGWFGPTRTSGSLRGGGWMSHPAQFGWPMSDPWVQVRVFSSTLLVEKGWSQLISLCLPAITPSGWPFYTKRGRKCKQGAMCTCAHPYGRAGWCGFGGRGVTKTILGYHE